MSPAIVYTDSSRARLKPLVPSVSGDKPGRQDRRGPEQRRRARRAVVDRRSRKGSGTPETSSSSSDPTRSATAGSRGRSRLRSRTGPLCARGVLSSVDEQGRQPEHERRPRKDRIVASGASPATRTPELSSPCRSDPSVSRSIAAMSDWLLPRTGQPLLPSRQNVLHEVREAGGAVDGQRQHDREHERGGRGGNGRRPVPRGRQIENEQRRKCFQRSCDRR